MASDLTSNTETATFDTTFDTTSDTTSASPINEILNLTKIDFSDVETETAKEAAPANNTRNIDRNDSTFENKIDTNDANVIDVVDDSVKQSKEKQTKTTSGHKILKFQTEGGDSKSDGLNVVSSSNQQGTTKKMCMKSHYEIKRRLSSMSLTCGETTKPNTEELTVPVFNTLMIKEMIDDTDGRLHIIGTLLQRTFGELPKKSKIEKTGFTYRFNDESAKGLVDFRKKGKKLVDFRHDVDKTSEKRDESKNKTLMTTFTYNARIPMKLTSTFNAFPFAIYKASANIELSSVHHDIESPEKGVDLKDHNEKIISLHPNHLIHMTDRRNNFSLQDLEDTDGEKERTSCLGRMFDSSYFLPKCMGTEKAKNDHIEKIKEKLDQSDGYDFICPFPKIYYIRDLKKKSCSKFKIEFMVVEGGSQQFITIFLPMILIATLSTINVWISNDLDNKDPDIMNDDRHLQISATIALAAVVLLPQMAPKAQKFSRGVMSYNNLYVFLVFVALSLSSFPPSCRYFAFSGAVLLWLCVLLPVIHFAQFCLEKRRIWKEHSEDHEFAKSDKTGESTYDQWKPGKGNFASDLFFACCDEGMKGGKSMQSELINHRSLDDVTKEANWNIEKSVPGKTRKKQTIWSM